MIKAVMLGRGSLLGGPCAPNYSSTSPFPSSGNFHLVAVFESIHYETLKARDTQSAGVERACSHLLREAGRMCIRVAEERMRTPTALSPGKAGAPLRPWSRKATAREDQTGAGHERHRPGPGGDNRNEPCPRNRRGRARSALPGLWNRSARTSTSRESLKSRLRDAVPCSAHLQAKGTHTLMVWGFSPPHPHHQGLPHSSQARDCSFVRNRTGPTLHV